MKTNFFLLLVCTFFLAIGNTSAQTDIIFKFKIWKNTSPSPTYLGEYTSSTNSVTYRGITSPIANVLNSGDELIIKNYCTLNGSPLNFDGISEKATIGLTNKTNCSIVGPPAIPNHLLHIADVCQGVSGCTIAPSFNNWSYGFPITITIPPYNSSTGNIYLMFAYGIAGTPISSCGCPHRYSFTKINITPTVVTPDPLVLTYLMHDEVYVEPNPIVTLLPGRLTVVNAYTGAPVQTVRYRAGFKFTYVPGIEYKMLFENEKYTHDEVFMIPATCSRNRSSNVSNNTNLNFEPTTLTAFPNPTTGLVNVQLQNTATSETNIQVLNVLGQVVLEKQVQNNNNIEIDLSEVTKGIYMLQVTNGDTEFTERITKE